MLAAALFFSMMPWRPLIFYIWGMGLTKFIINGSFLPIVITAFTLSTWQIKSCLVPLSHIPLLLWLHILTGSADSDSLWKCADWRQRSSAISRVDIGAVSWQLLAPSASLSVWESSPHYPYTHQYSTVAAKACTKAPLVLSATSVNTVQ